MLDAIRAEYGLGGMANDMERHIWLGHSLPPSISRRYYSTRSNFRVAKMNNLIMGALPEDGDVSLSKFHRVLNDAVEFVSEFGDEKPDEFDEMLLEYLAD